MRNLSKVKKKNFVICAVMGGIGDQIFQFSFANFLAKKLNCNIILDISYYKNKKNYNNFSFRLKYLAKVKKIKLGENISKINFLYLSYLRFIKIINLNKLIPVIYKLFFKINILNFFYDYFKDKNQKLIFEKNSYYFGYWHNFKFVKKLKREINIHLLNPELTKKKIKKYKNKINNKIIAIHIRGGDFVKYWDRNILNYKYYDDAINFYLKKIKSPKFHIFTDDRNTTKKIISKLTYKKNIKIISNKKLNDIEEFALFSEYKYAIIGNSTFSLMSSFLSYKRILSVGPLNWFKNEKLPKEKIFPKLKLI